MLEAGKPLKSSQKATSAWVPGSCDDSCPVHPEEGKEEGGKDDEEDLPAAASVPPGPFGTVAPSLVRIRAEPNLQKTQYAQDLHVTAADSSYAR